MSKIEHNYIEKLVKKKIGLFEHIIDDRGGITIASNNPRVLLWASKQLGDNKMYEENVLTLKISSSVRIFYNPSLNNSFR